MHFLGYCRKSVFAFVLLESLTIGQVVYAAGVNEKLLGDFIRKHNLRDKLFSTLFMSNHKRRDYSTDHLTCSCLQMWFQRLWGRERDELCRPYQRIY
jgi:hypothetical protein